MENVNTKEGYNFKMLPGKTLAVQSGVDNVFYCPFCYSQTTEAETKCGVCNKTFPELIYYHSDDDIWIASGNENCVDSSGWRWFVAVAGPRTAAGFYCGNRSFGFSLQQLLLLLEQ